MDHQNNLDGFNYDLNQYQGTPPSDVPIFTNYDQQLTGSLSGQYYGDPNDGMDENDPKRRRIARVCDYRTTIRLQANRRAGL